MRALWHQTRNGIAALKPGSFPWGRFALAMLIGIAGGWGFASLRLPLPWMLGPMSACTLAAVLGLPVAAPPVIRPPMTLVIGVLLGTAFKPDFFHQFPQWLPALAGLVVFMAVSALACVTFFRRVGGFDRTTAYFAGMPGGLVEMVTVGEERGGDGRMIALVHSARILLVVMTLPFAIQMMAGIQLGGRRPAGISIVDTPLVSDLWLVGCGIVGLFVGQLLRMPAKFLLGPMLVTAVVHIAGLATFSPPSEVIIMAQLVLGVTIGCRFVGTPPREIGRILGLSVGSTIILLFFTVIFALLISRMTDFGVVPLMLAYAAGGLAEMSLIALALHVEVAFVAAHHIVRIFLVMVGAGPLFGVFLGDDTGAEASD
ncbi:MAG: monooxygenase [Rhizobiales bacterium PAR1]|nr:MAG: monooxygenase [Rhizobiales bacterium PAR1]